MGQGQHIPKQRNVINEPACATIAKIELRNVYVR